MTHHKNKKMAGQAALPVKQKCRTADSTYTISTEQIPWFSAVRAQCVFFARMAAGYAETQDLLNMKYEVETSDPAVKNKCACSINVY